MESDGVFIKFTALSRSHLLPGRNLYTRRSSRFELAMIILTDSIAFAQDCVPQMRDWRQRHLSTLGAAEQALANELFEAASVMVTEVPGERHLK